MPKTVKVKGRKGDILDNVVRVETSLPPDVKGQLRCFLAVQVDYMAWKVKNHPKDIHVCLQWWGETSDGTIFSPSPRRVADKTVSLPNTDTFALFPVCSGPKQFAAYLQDMGVLVLDVLHSKTLKPFGKVEIHEIARLSGSNPIDRWYPVTSLSVQPVKFADLHVILRFEPVDIAGRDLSSVIPVIDQDFQGSHVNSVVYDNRSVKDKEQFEVNKDDSLETKSGHVHSEEARENDEANQDDVISSLIERGKSLRDSIMESTVSAELDPAKDLLIREELGANEEENLECTTPGSLFKEILKLDDAENIETSLPVDLIVEDENDDDLDLLDDYNSTSVVGSDSDDPVYDDTLLQDLFYTNKADIPVLAELTNSNDVDEDEKKEQLAHAIERREKTETAENILVDVREKRLLEKAGETMSQQSVVAESFHMNKLMHSAENKPPLSGNLQNEEFLTRLGVNKLTALGRVTAARVTIRKLDITEQSERHEQSNRTYFIEYDFPVAASYGNDKTQNNNKDVGLEVTRIATKKSKSHSIVFNHHSVFPVLFDSIVTSFWWNFGLKINTFERRSGQKSPRLIGVGHLNLKTVLLSHNLVYDGVIDVRAPKSQDKGAQFGSSGSSASSSESTLIAKLEVKINLMSNGKDLDFQAPESEPLQENEHPELNASIAKLKQRGYNGTERVEQYQSSQIHISKNRVAMSGTADVTLMTLLWISEGRNIVRNGHGIQVSVPGGVTRSNFYLISRMFWSNDTSRSAVCWGKSDPAFNFKQTSPVLLTRALLNRMHNNFITVEVWNKTGGKQDDEFIGIAKLPLQQLYLSYKEEQITKTLLKSKFPVIAVDSWIGIKNPFKDSCQGELRVLLAMGSKNQITRLLEMKECKDAEDNGKLLLNPERDRSPFDASFIPENQVEHHFEITVHNVKNLFAFEKTLWGETDCFVQYNFPYQRPDTESRGDGHSCQDVPGLQSHRTSTTLCVPDTSFNDVARYGFVLPRTLPVQRFLLAAFHGSWTKTGHSSAAGAMFELWKRHYYPNIRDQLVAKGILPLAKLCGMITMEKPGEGSIQSFCLPLTILPSMEDKRSEQEGVLSVTVKYRQSKLPAANIHGQPKRTPMEENTQVCLLIEVIRACGLKCALSKLARDDSSLKYASEVGGNVFVRIKLPFNVKIEERATRTIARTFTPEFGYRLELVLPLVVQDHITGGSHHSFGTLAECLELGEVLLELWHQRPRQPLEHFDLAVPQTDGIFRRHFTSACDIRLGFVKIPLQQLLFSHTVNGIVNFFDTAEVSQETNIYFTALKIGPVDPIRFGIKGWFPISAHNLGWESDHLSSNVLDKTVGGLEIRMNFTEIKERDKIIDSGRALGWSPPLWYEIEREPVFSAIGGLRKIKETDVVLCDLKHTHSYLVKTTSPFVWYIREERLEIQVWLTDKHREEKRAQPAKRDNLVGSAFVHLFPLLDGSNNRAEVSGLEPLFRSSALDLGGAGMHVQLVLHKPSKSQQTLFHSADVDEGIVSSERSSSIAHDKASFTADSSDEDKIQNAPTSEGKQKERLSAHDDHDNDADSDKDDTITAHVIVEQALHLPQMKTPENKSVLPNAYVSYQLRSDRRPFKTKIIPSTTSPFWDHEKLTRFRQSELIKQVLIFKVWNSQNSSETVSSSNSDGAREDVLVGLASVDLSPLASGLRQVVGWYNIVDIGGQCKGQIKVGVTPLSPVSPTRFTSLPQKAKEYKEESKRSKIPRDSASRLPEYSNEDNFRMFSSTINPLPYVEIPDSSRSFLLRQLRKNMTELDMIQDKLKERLVNNDDEFSTQPPTLMVPEEVHQNYGDETKTEQVKSFGNMAASSFDNDEHAHNLTQDAFVDTSGHKNKSLLEKGNLEVEFLLESSETTDYTADGNTRDGFHAAVRNQRDNSLEDNTLKDDSPNNETSRNETLINNLVEDDLLNNDSLKECQIAAVTDDNNRLNLERDDYRSYSDDIITPEHDNYNVSGNASDTEMNLAGQYQVHGGFDLHAHKPAVSTLASLNVGLFAEHHVADCDERPDGLTVDSNTSHDNSGISEVRDSPGRSRPLNCDETLGNTKVAEASEDESLDSFFDCLPKKRNAKRTHDRKQSLDDSDDIIESQSVITRKNLEKLKNVVDKEINNGEQEINCESTPVNNDRSTNRDTLAPVENSVVDHKQYTPCLEKNPSETNELPKSTAAKEQLMELTTERHDHNPMYSLDRNFIPNFFMPPKDLEQSMRSLRLAATFRKQPVKEDIAEEQVRQQCRNMKDKHTSTSRRECTANERGMIKSFADWKQVHKVRTTGQAPLSLKEASRLARIFSSNYSAEEN